MNTLKTLIIVTDLTLGGIQNYVRASANLLKEMNHKVFIIAINEAYKFKDIETISLNNYSSYKKPLFISQFIKENAIDVVMDHRTKSNILKQKVYDFLLRKTPKIQFIHSAHFDFYFYSWKVLNQFAYKHTTTFVSVSNYIDQLVSKEVTAKHQVLYHYFDDLAVHQNQDKKDILFVGRFENDVKDLTFLLEAYHLSELHVQNVQFHFVGSGKDAALIKQFAANHNLEQKIVVHAATNDIAPFYQNAKVVVLASHFEGFPLVLMEALHHGTPVITTPFNNSVYELVKHQQNGLIVEKQLDIFAESLQKMFHNEELYNELLKNTQFFNEKFSKENAIKQWDMLLRDLF